ncbi:Ig-like domain-containing protein, partial [Acinetobacter defluvii]|uniref:Ig-like domain-containing protein n=1 Tax=Acinetobacter defluvii TaxID=1871111 RepID=UPI0014905C2D
IFTLPLTEQGHWSVTTEKPLQDGTKLTATTDNQDGVLVTDEAPLPYVSIDIVAGDDVINEQEKAELTDSEGNIKITGTVSNPDAQMTITFNGKIYTGSEIEITPNGQWSIKVPAKDVQSENHITATGTVTTEDGKVIESNEADRGVGTDTVPPSVKVEITPEGEIKVSFDPDVDPSSITPDDVKITDKDGNPIEITLTPSEDGLTWTGKVPPNVEGEVNVEIPPTYKDESGNVGEPGKGTGTVDTVPPGVNIDITPDGKITITFDPDVDPTTIDPNDIVITDKDGKPLTDKEGNPIEVEFTPNEDGLTWTGKVPPNVDTDITVEIPPTDEAGNPTYRDEVGNPGTGGDKTVPVDTLPPKVTVEISEDRTSVTFIFNEVIQGFDASDIVVAGGMLKPDTLVKNADGTWTAQLQNTEKGNTVEVMVKDQSYTDLTNNAGAAGADRDITIKITSVTPIEGSNDKLIKGMTGANQEVTVILPNGDEITGIRSDKNGYWQLTTAIVEGTNDEITAQTKNQDKLTVEDIISLPFVSIDLVSGDDVINEAEYSDLENTVTITGKVSNPDVTMTVTIAGKTYSGSQVTVNVDGTWSVNVPKADVAKDFDITAQATSNKSGVTSDEALRDVMVDIEPPKVTVEIDATGKITLKYDSDVDPNSIDLSKVTVKDTSGNVITVNWNMSDSSALNFDAMIDMPVDDIITVTVPEGSYQDLVGNLGLEGLDAEDVDNAPPDIEKTLITTEEDTSVVITWAQLGITDNSTDLNKLAVSFTTLPTNGTLYLNGQAVTDINMLADLTKSDIDAGQLSFKPDLNEASTSTGSVYTTLDFEVHDGVNTSTGSVDVIVNAVADKPNLSIDILDWAPTAVNLNIKTWNGLQKVTIDGKTYDLLQGGGDGMPADTLKTVFEYLTSDRNTTHKPATSGGTTSLTNGDVATYKGVAITGYVYLEKGHTYNYKGVADDSGMLIIGNEDPVFVSWGGLSTSVDRSFTATESGFYTFDFYMHNQAGIGNYDFQLVDQSHGDTISYYPDLDTALSGLNDFYQQTNPSVEWKVSDLIQGSVTDKDENGFHRPYFNLSGEVGHDISLGLLNTSLNDVDGSESLTLNFSGLVEGMMIYALASDGSRTLLGTADANGQLSFLVDGWSLDGASLVAVAPADFVVTDSSLALKVKVEAVATEQSNGSTASSELAFDMTLYPPSNVAFKAMAFTENTAVEQDPDLIFNVLSDDHLDRNTLTTVNDFASTDQIDVSKLLDDHLRLENTNAYLTVSYDAEHNQALIAIDHDDKAAQSQSAELLLANHPTTDLTLEELLQNNQIII